MNKFLVAGLAIAAFYLYLRSQKKGEDDTVQEVLSSPAIEETPVTDLTKKPAIFPPEIAKSYNTEKWATVSPINITIIKRSVTW